MVRRTLKNITNKIEGIHQAAFWLSLFALCSQILALLRDRLLAHQFGASTNLDVYYAAFEIPDLLFVTIASIVSISALVPLFARKQSEGEKYLKEATDSIFTVFSVTIVCSSVIAWFAMPYIIPIAFAGLSALNQQETVFLSRVLLLSPLLLGFSNFFGSIVQYEKRFILYSISPILYNIGILFGIVFLTESFGVAGVVFGVVIGALLHLSLQAIFVILSPMRPRITSRIDWKVVWETTLLSVPRTLALSIASFVGFFFAAIASGFGEGSIAVFTLASNLQSVPLSLIGVSFSLAAFPALAISAAKKDLDEVMLKMSDGLRHIIFWSLPVTALIIVLRAHVVRVILGSGVFDWSATRLTAASLALFVVSTVFQSLALFLSRSHYALGKTKLPLMGNVVGGIVSICSAYLFMKYINFFMPWLLVIANTLHVADLNQSVLLLPIGFSIGSIVSAAFLFYALGRELVYEIKKRVAKSAVQALISSVVCGAATYLILALSGRFFDTDTFIGIFGHALIASTVGIMAWVLSLYALKNTELREVVSRFK